MNIIGEQLNAQQSGKNYALVTVISVEGPSSSNPGKKMIVYSSGEIVGTVGGGNFEMKCIEDAKKQISKGTTVEVFEYDLESEKHGSKAQVLIESFMPRTTVVVLGAGHVGGAVLKAANMLNFQTILIDSRPQEQIKDKIELADRFITCEDYEQGVLNADIPEGAYYICATWGHVHDKFALKGALGKNAAYVGMIGSPDKIKEIFSMLKSEGIEDEQLKKVYSPVGLDICNGSPEEIGFAIVAEMLKIKNNGTGEHCKHIKK